jgi:MoxR-like ATPase
MTSPNTIQQRAEQFRGRYANIQAEIGKVIVGHTDIVHGVLTCLFVGGHALLEGVPGLGKTLLVRTLSQVLDLNFNRIQFTPDLMPSDIIGTNIITESPDGKRVFSFQSGPLFAQIVLADEINRATPKTQSALLEAMQEHSVTVGGTIHRLQEPFFVMATQNPIEQEGTYPLPEAQLDRFFFKLIVNYSGREEMATILDRTTRNEWPQPQKVMDGTEIREWQQLVREVLVAPPVQDYAIRLVLATHPGGEFATPDANRYIRCGASPRGAQALVLAGKVRALLEGRYNVSFEDIRRVYLPALRHRVLLNFEAQAENIASDVVLMQILKEVKERVSDKELAAMRPAPTVAAASP